MAVVNAPFTQGCDRIMTLGRQKYYKNRHEMLYFGGDGQLEQDKLMTIGDNRRQMPDNNTEWCKNISRPLVAL